jgi:hypothetical protein
MRIALDLRPVGVERIEEEMRVKLHAQGIQARLRKLHSIFYSRSSLAR